MAGGLGDLGQCIRGISYKPSQVKAEETQETVRLYRSTNIQDGEIVEEKLIFLPNSIVSKERILHYGDLIVCMSNGSKALVGKSAPFRSEDNCHSVGSFCAIFRTRDPELRDFVRFLFQSLVYDRHVLLALAGSSINNLKNSDIERMCFLFLSINKRLLLLPISLTR
ncbi:MAG: hypothetical protein F4Z75_09070 [Synechococcus sp. SB0668_bin_15]|nr:hypothetical protein [Synechococcus sp. SB0668_bin_15]MYC48757.1 hypothetical protein [Synechococcus sp. SB0662_bin_14]